MNGDLVPYRGGELGPELGEFGEAVSQTITGAAAEGRGETFRLRANWPSVAQLEYVQKFATSGLLAVGFLLLVGYAFLNPAGALGVLAKGAKKRAGIE